MKKSILVLISFFVIVMLLSSCEIEDIPEIPEVGQFTTASSFENNYNNYIGDKASLEDLCYQMDWEYSQREIEKYEEGIEDSDIGYGDFQQFIDKMYREKLNLDILIQAGYELDERTLEYKSHLDSALANQSVRYYEVCNKGLLEKGGYDTGWLGALEIFAKKCDEQIAAIPELVDFLQYCVAEIMHRGNPITFMTSANILDGRSYFSDSLEVNKLINGEPFAVSQYYDEELRKIVIKLSRDVDIIMRRSTASGGMSFYEYSAGEKIIFPINTDETILLAEVGEYGYVKNPVFYTIKNELAAVEHLSADFKSPILEKALRKYLKKEENDIISYAELAEIERISVYGENVYFNGEKIPQESIDNQNYVVEGGFSLEDIRHFLCLESLSVSNNEIKKLELEKSWVATRISFINCGIEKIAGETYYLKSLMLYGNNIKDTSALKKMESITQLSLLFEPIEVVEIHDKITTLSLVGTKVKDISFVNALKDLDNLDIRETDIKDISCIDEAILKTLNSLSISEGIDYEFLLKYENIKSISVGNETIR